MLLKLDDNLKVDAAESLTNYMFLTASWQSRTWTEPKCCKSAEAYQNIVFCNFRQFCQMWKGKNTELNPLQE